MIKAIVYDTQDAECMIMREFGSTHGVPIQALEPQNCME